MLVERRQYRVTRGMTVAARVIGLGTVGFVLTFLIGETSAEYLAKGWAAVTVEAVIVGVITGIALAGCIISWGKQRAAGVMLIVSAFLTATNIPPLQPLIPNNVRVWLIVGLPYLVAGTLFLNSWRLSRSL
jgi:multisubunit Na+/H+ antiporter MnhF subunit